MRAIRRLIVFLSSAVALWVLASFAGAMFNPANAAFWTDSLMWSLLAGLSTAPALLIIHHASASNAGREIPASPEQKPFVHETARLETLWPDPVRHSSDRPATDEWSHKQDGVVA